MIIHLFLVLISLLLLIIVLLQIVIWGESTSTKLNGTEFLILLNSSFKFYDEAEGIIFNGFFK